MLEVCFISVFEVDALTIISHKPNRPSPAYFVLANEVSSSNVDMPNLVFRLKSNASLIFKLFLNYDVNANEFQL